VKLVRMHDRENPNVMHRIDCPAFDLLDAGCLYTRRFQERCRDLPLDLTHCRVLVALAENEGLMQQRLAESIGSTPAVLSRILDQLEVLRLVKRRLQPGDRRARSLAITQEGRALVPLIWSIIEELQHEALKGLSTVEVEIVAKALARVLTNLSGPKSGVAVREPLDRPGSNVVTHT
jgi:MarR family transcriptional regulator, transcriptional regulator for hemolysin